MAKVYTHAVKAGGRIIAAGVPVEVTPIAADEVFTDEYMNTHSAEEAQSAFDSLKKALESDEADVTSTTTKTADTADTVDTAELNKMKKAELEEFALSHGISLDGCSTKAEYVAAITAFFEVSE